MKDYRRAYPLFSLCGLNCALCSMHQDKQYCPGCGGGPGNQRCAIITCAEKHGSPEFCFLCGEFPCGKYDGIDAYDSFISHRNQLADLEKAQAVGLDAYRAELEEKQAILRHLLAQYNDGRRKTLFCNAVNLLPLEDLREITARLAAETTPALSEKERGALAAGLLQAAAAAREIPLKLRKKK